MPCRPSRKSPLFVCLTSVILLFGVSAISSATPVVTIIAPSKGSSAGSPVFFQAYATSASCASGISGMRIYSAPYQPVYYGYGSHVEAFIDLAPGTYSTVVEAWDNCGGVGEADVNVSVTSSPGVSVFQPRAPLETPVHVAASAQSPSCSAGINAMRVYVASGVAPYTVYSNEVDVYLNELAGQQADITVQAWDNCGHVYKSEVNTAIDTAEDHWLYAINASPNAVAQFDVSTSGVLSIPGGKKTPPLLSLGAVPTAIAVDPGGWFVYVASAAGIYAFEVDAANGQLYPVSGSPFGLNGTTPAALAMDAGGNFLYVGYSGSNTVADYSINRSSGVLTPLTSIASLPGLVGLTSDCSGQFVYAIGVSSYQSQIAGYRLNQNNGDLAQINGSPYALSGDSLPEGITATTGYLLADSDQNLWSFSVNYTTGALTQVPGDPFYINEPLIAPQDLLADREGRYIWSGQAAPTDPPQGWVDVYQMQSSGATSLNSTNYDYGNHEYPALAESFTGKYVYGGGQECTQGGAEVTCTGSVKSWSVASDGGVTTLSSPLNAGGNPAGIALVRRRQQ